MLVFEKGLNELKTKVKLLATCLQRVITSEQNSGSEMTGDTDNSNTCVDNNWRLTTGDVYRYNDKLMYPF